VSGSGIRHLNFLIPEALYETTIVNVCTTDKIAVENRSHNLN
jgi:hypothetical protein